MNKHKVKVIFATALFTIAALPAQAQDWTGAYIGASASSHSGTAMEYDVEVPGTSFDYDRSGTMRSLLAGYRIQNDALVYGVEVSRSTGALRLPEPYTKNHISDYTTLMGKVGYAQDNALFSAGLGYFQGEIKPVCIDVCGIVEMSGLAISLGVDYLVTENVTVGAAVTRRTFEKAPYPKLPQYETSGNDTAFEFRVGYNF